jgi:hypothetical protein
MKRYIKETVANDTPYEIYQINELIGEEVAGSYRVVACFFKESEADEYLIFMNNKQAKYV